MNNSRFWPTVVKRLLKLGRLVLICWLLFHLFGTVAGRLSFQKKLRISTGIQISFFYQSHESRLIHSPSAFDSDYFMKKVVKVSRANMTSITHAILASDSFGSTLGWTSSRTGFEFNRNRELHHGEITYVQIDTSSRMITYRLTHL